MQPACELPQLRGRIQQLRAHLSDARRQRRVHRRPLRQNTELEAERHQALLRAVVQVPFDPLPGSILGSHNPARCCLELLGHLDNNAGVFHNLLDSSEEEHLETVLAYWFLLSDGPADTLALDHGIETWLADRWDCDVDFEVHNALAKLSRLGLATPEADQWHAT